MHIECSSDSDTVLVCQVSANNCAVEVKTVSLSAFCSITVFQMSFE